MSAFGLLPENWSMALGQGISGPRPLCLILLSVRERGHPADHLWQSGTSAMLAVPPSTWCRGGRHAATEFWLSVPLRQAVSRCVQAR